jgi:hypothetical protein
MKSKTIIGTVLLILISLLSPACATRREPPDGESILMVSSSGEASLSLPYGKAVRLTGEAFSRDDGSWVFHMDYLEWFSNWYKGWTEALFGVTGSILLIPAGDSWEMEIQEFPLIGSVLEGQVRLGETRYYGDRSRDMSSRRWTRVSGAAPFIMASLPVMLFSQEFPGDLESLLFPEVYGYGGVLPPPEDCSGIKLRYVRGEGVRWDSCYSRAYIPPELQPVRDAGTLYRDYVECPGFFTLACTWDMLWEESLSHSDFVVRRIDND